VLGIVIQFEASSSYFGVWNQNQTRERINAVSPPSLYLAAMAFVSSAVSLSLSLSLFVIAIDGKIAVRCR
jgi:hypothetical protein